MRHAIAGLGVLALSVALPFAVQAQQASKYYLGLHVADKAEGKLGYQILKIFPDSPAARSKDPIHAGDFVTQVNQKPVTTWEKLRADVQASPGGKVTFVLTDMKTKKPRTVSVQMVDGKLAPKPAPKPAAKTGLAKP